MTSCSSFLWLVLFAKLVVGQETFVVLNPDHLQWQIGIWQIGSAGDPEQVGETLTYVGQNVDGVRALDDRKTVVDWDVYKQLVQTGLGMLGIQQPDYGSVAIVVVRAANQGHPTNEMVGIANCMFGLEVPIGKLYIAKDAVCVLHSTNPGSDTGVVVEVLDGTTYVVPIQGGFTVDHAIEVEGLQADLETLRDSTHTAIQKTDVAERFHLYINMVLFGSQFDSQSAATFNGLMQEKADDHYNLQTSVSSVNGIMFGGALMGAAASGTEMWVTLEEYLMAGAPGCFEKWY